MLKIEENVNIKDYCTLKVGGQFRYFAKVTSIDELESLCKITQNELKTKIFILGGGSNIIFSDGVLDVLAIKIEIKGFNVINETNTHIDIKIGAGEIWDKIVEKTVLLGISGLESLSAIPGTVGATPVQNVGAYGAEVKDTILEVEVFDIIESKIKVFSNADCKFGYRDSIFKNEVKGKYIITSVIFRLAKSVPLIPNYPGVLKYFVDRKIEYPTLIQIRDAIIYIRKEKLPNPEEIPTVGSFFKNPIVENEVAEKINKEYSNAKFFPIDETHIKVPAGWLIENAGLKGKSFGKVSVYNKNALVLINEGDATQKDVMKARDEIIKIVLDKFGIILEQEPEMM